MAIPLTINGAVFEYPENLDQNWGINATGWAQAVTNGMLQMAGGSFPLTADVNFGPNFGLISKYFETRSANPASIGTLRLSSADAGVAFRNNTNSGNLVITTDSSDNLLYNGHIIGASGSGSVLSITGTVDQVIASSPTGNVTLSLPQSIAATSSPTFAGLILSSSLTVPNGGTGDASFTAYALLTGGTTSTGPIQSIASVGTAGQVLTSNGTGALPSFTNATGTGTVNSGITPNIAYYATSSSVLSDSGISRANLFLTDGTVSATGAFNLNSHKVTNLTNGSNPQDAVAFTQLSTGSAITAGGITSATITTTQVASNTLTGSTANSGGSAGNIAQGTISTPDFRANAVTQILSTGDAGFGVLGGGDVVAKSQAITTIAGSKVMLFGSVSLSSGSVNAATVTWITRGTTAIPGNAAEANNFGTSQPLCMTVCCVDTPGAGTFTYNLNYNNGGLTTTLIMSSLVVVEQRA